ncbi:MAG: hypothetical protein GXO78_07930 [Calditrichaeota bacterium]|nr:hypothetical protein [Calditrichota bacterium]
MNRLGKTVLEYLEKLLNLQELSVQSVGFALHCNHFLPLDDSGTLYTQVWRSFGDGQQIAVVEVREVVTPDNQKGALVILGLEPEVILRGKEVLLRFGEPDEVILSYPDGPINGRMYTYKRHAHTLTFGVDGTTDKVTHVIIDYRR